MESLLRAATERTELRKMVAHLRHELALAQAHHAAAAAERDALLASSSWRLTRPLRALRALLAPRPGTPRTADEAKTVPGPRTAADPQTKDRGDAPQTIPTRDESEYQAWVAQHDRLRAEDRQDIAAAIDHMAERPLCSILLTVGNARPGDVAQALGSIAAQLYGAWEVLLIPADSAPLDLSLAPDLMARIGPRLRILRESDAPAYCGALAAAVTEARGSILLVMDAAIRLAEQALFEYVGPFINDPDCAVVYADEDRLGDDGRRWLPFFKPDWNVDLALTHNIVGRAAAYRRSSVQALCAVEPALEPGPDLALRLAGAMPRAKITHVPAILFHQQDAPEPAEETENAPHWLHRDAHSYETVRACLDALGHHAVTITEAVPGQPLFRLQWPLPDPPPRVSVIIPMRDQALLLTRCIGGLLHQTDYPDLEILILDNGSTEPEALRLLARLPEQDARVRVLRHPGPFNYAALNNHAAAEASGEILLLLNNDVEVIESGWLRELAAHAIRPDIGAVGARLLYADRRVQHAGVVLGVGSHAGGPGVAGHFGQGAEAEDVGYFGQFILTREVSAVTGACLALRRSVYQQVGGLDAKNLPVAFNDVDLCLRIRALGLRIIWTPFAELYHLESVSRGRDFVGERELRAAEEANYMRAQWGAVLDRDPFYNPNFDRRDHHFNLRQKPPPRSWRRPDSVQ
ncbi:hypothetical protein AcidC75_33680 [Acidisoma sp. C75]